MRDFGRVSSLMMSRITSASEANLVGISFSDRSLSLILLRGCSTTLRKGHWLIAPDVHVAVKIVDSYGVDFCVGNGWKSNRNREDTNRATHCLDVLFHTTHENLLPLRAVFLPNSEYLYIITDMWNDSSVAPPNYQWP